MNLHALLVASILSYAVAQPGAPVPISSAEAEEAAYEALLLFSLTSQRTNALGLNHIADAQRQVVSGTKYILVLIAGETDCPVKAVQTATALKNCAVTGPLVTYDVEIWDQAWRTPRFTLLKFDPLETAACADCRRQQTDLRSFVSEARTAATLLSGEVGKNFELVDVLSLQTQRGNGVTYEFMIQVGEPGVGCDAEPANQDSLLSCESPFTKTFDVKYVDNPVVEQRYTLLGCHEVYVDDFGLPEESNPALKMESPVLEVASAPQAPALTSAMYRVLAAAACLCAVGAAIVMRRGKGWGFQLEESESAGKARHASHTKTDYSSFSGMS